MIDLFESVDDTHGIVEKKPDRGRASLPSNQMKLVICLNLFQVRDLMFSHMAIPLKTAKWRACSVSLSMVITLWPVTSGLEKKCS